MGGPPPGRSFSAPSCAIRRGVAAPTMGRRALLCFCGRPDPGPKLFQHRAAPFAAGSRLPQWLLWEARPRAEAFSAPSCAIRRGVAAPTMGRRALLCFCGRPAPGAKLFLRRAAPFAAGSRFPQWLRRALLCSCGRPAPGPKLFCTELHRSPRGRGSHNGATCTALFSRKTRRRMHKVPGRLHFGTGRAGVAHQTSCA